MINNFKTNNIIAIALLALIWQNSSAFAEESQKMPTAKAKIVRYEDFGAIGDGKTDDIDAIVKAHKFANKHKLPVKADDNATYYIGGQDKTAIIQTDTDFGTAKFIIDDTTVDNHRANIFDVLSSKTPIKPEGITSLKRHQTKIDTLLPENCIILVTNSKVKHFIRKGLNQDSGSALTDVFIADKNGDIDKNTPIIWDVDEITHIVAFPIDSKILKVHGGRFTTIANNDESKYKYYGRGILIRRSNVVIDDLEHRVTKEGDHGSPYGGFISIKECANVTVRNTTLTGHKTYSTIGRAGKPVSMGSYDITVNRAINVLFENCSQFDDINDRSHWGIMGSNYSKNIQFENCKFSRFDAHKGVVNATIRNSTLGHVGLNAIGEGTLLVENTTINGGNFINLRGDYGSTWHGEFIIRNCKFNPKYSSGSLIDGNNNGQHDFGYTCYMPEKITIDGLYIDDSKHPKNYNGMTIFADFNPNFKTPDFKEKFPYIKTKEVVLKDITTASGKPLRISNNKIMFKDTIITK